MYYNRARYYDPSNGRFNRTDPYAGNTQDPQSLHKYLYCHNNPVNMVDPSGMFPSIVVKIAVLAVKVAIMAILATIVYRIYRATGGPAYLAGLDHSSITDADIVACISGFNQAAIVLEDIIEPIEICPSNWDEIHRQLEAKNVFQAGEMLIGVTGVGHLLPEGQQQIIRYFESLWWNLFHPEARQHGSYNVGGTHPYIPCKAEVKRMRIIVEELKKEAINRGIKGY